MRAVILCVILVWLGLAPLSFATPKCAQTPIDLLTPLAPCPSAHWRADRRENWAALAAAAPDRAAARVDAAFIRKRLALLKELSAPQAEIAPSQWPQFAGSTAGFRAAYAGSKNSRVRALLRRAIADQIIRFAIADVRQDALLNGASERVRDQWSGFIVNEMAAIDCANTRWLYRQIVRHGWFISSVFGREADHAAWLLVQHADAEPRFQREALRLLESLPAGETRLQNIALLWDRVAVSEGRTQRFATQMRCIDGAMQPVGGVEEGVDAHRKAAGLPPLADYRALLAKIYRCGAGA
ncbi:MAG: DUF6624 domain-containing protein [Caulobacterales bacterium]